MAPKKSKLEKSLLKDVESGERSLDMRGSRTEGERYLNIFIICSYLTLIGLYIYTINSVFDTSSEFGTAIGQDVSIIVSSTMILITVLLTFSVLSAGRWFYGSFGKGEHITFFVFTSLAFILSLLTSIISGVFLYGIETEGITSEAKDALEFTFWTNLSTSVITSMFLFFYIFRPQYLMN